MVLAPCGIELLPLVRFKFQTMDLSIECFAQRFPKLPRGLENTSFVDKTPKNAMTRWKSEWKQHQSYRRGGRIYGTASRSITGTVILSQTRTTNLFGNYLTCVALQKKPSLKKAKVETEDRHRGRSDGKSFSFSISRLTRLIPRTSSFTCASPE